MLFGLYFYETFLHTTLWLARGVSGDGRNSIPPPIQNIAYHNHMKSAQNYNEFPILQFSNKKKQKFVFKVEISNSQANSIDLQFHNNKVSHLNLP